MSNQLFAGLLTATLTVGTALPAFAADAPLSVAESRQIFAQAGSQSASAGMSDGDAKEIRALLAGVSSVILPGFGQWVFNQERPKAVMHLLGAVVLWAIPSYLSIPGPLDRLYLALPTLFHLYSGYDAYQGAGGEVDLISQPGLTAWSFDAQVSRLAQEQRFAHAELSHLQLGPSELAPLALASSSPID